MPNQHSINGFTKGMNKDLDISVLQKDMYLDAKNFRVITTEGSTSTALEVVDGNIIQSNIAISSGYSIIGYGTIRNKLILFTTNNTNSIIYMMDVVNGTATNFTVLYDDNLSPDSTLFNFSTSYPIKAIGRYETSDIQKIYWTDNYNSLRFINIADTSVQTYSINRFEILPPVDYIPIIIDSIGTGNLKAGKVQYAYQLYNLNETESPYIKMADFVALSNNILSTTDKDFTGTKEGETSGKSVTFSMTGLDTNFNRIRVIRLLYTNINEIPVITIIKQGVLSANMTFVDEGTENLGELTLEEFSFINYDFTCEDIDTKNNILFAANINETVWDVDYDARAFRFCSSTVTGTYTAPTAALYTTNYLGALTTYTATQLGTDKISHVCTIPETHDAVCAQNSLELDNLRDDTAPANVYLYNYLYQSDGSTLGGEGINVSYTFTTSTETIAVKISKVVTETNYESETSNQFTFTHLRDEIYAYGIQFQNTKGQYSYVKWIGDIRIPDASLSTYTTSGSNELYSKPISIIFSINNIPANCTYRIVRCERKAQDRTILSQGLLSSSRIFVGATTFNCAAPMITTVRQMKSPTPAIAGTPAIVGVPAINLDNTVVQLYSPDISFGNNIEYSSNDRLDFIGLIPIRYNYYVNGTISDSKAFTSNLNYYPITGSDNSFINVKCTSGAYFDLGTLSKIDITDSKVVETDPSSGNTTISGNAVIIGSSDQFENYCRAFGLENTQGKSSRCIIMKLPSEIDLSTIVDTSATYGKILVICNYRRKLVPYGGQTYLSRFSREYIPVSFSTSSASTSIEGDSFISYFELQRSTTVIDGEGPANPEENLLEIIKFPVETSINTRWRTGTTFCQSCISGLLINRLGSMNFINIQEKSGTHINGNIKLVQEHGLYEYNSVYSRQNNLLKAIPKPFDITDNKTYDARVIASDQKFNGEESDSWTKFRLNNFIDVDSTYGSINNILSYNNELYFWQDKGFGHLSVNQRSLLQDNNPGALIVGTGGILDRFDYISTTCGNISKFGIIKSNHGLYWLDSMNSILFRFTNELEPLSKTKGLQSYINNNVTKTTTAIGGYDIKYNDVFITLSGNTETIIFNELTDSFSPFQTMVPSRYIQMFDGTFSSTTDNINVYRHNGGVKGSFFGTVYPSSIKFIVNDNYDYTKVFDSIEYKSKSYNSSDVLLYNDTFNTLSVYNDKQYTGVVSIVTDNTLSTWNTVKREGNFSTIIPRNIVNANITSSVDIFNPLNQNISRLYKERIRDKYCIIELTYNNTNGYKLSIPYIKTNYRISYR